MRAEHTSDHDLQRYCLGLVSEKDELARLDEHIQGCSACAERVEETQGHLDAMRVALLELDH